MAEIMSFYDFDLNTASPEAKSIEDIKTQSGVAFYYNDYTTLGYLKNGDEITHLLVGYFVPTYGFSVKSIDLKNPSEPVLSLDVGTYDTEDFYYYGTLNKPSYEKIADAQMIFNSNYEEKDYVEALKHLEESLQLLQSSQPANFKLANKILADAKEKYKELFLTVPKIRGQAPSTPLKEYQQLKEDEEDPDLISIREFENRF